jgi:hypothetical protein
VSEIIGPAGNDIHRRGVPNLEGGEKRIAALVHERQRRPFRRAGEPVQLADAAGRANGEAVSRGVQRMPAELAKVDQGVDCQLRF